MTHSRRTATLHAFETQLALVLQTQRPPEQRQVLGIESDIPYLGWDIQPARAALRAIACRSASFPTSNLVELVTSNLRREAADALELTNFEAELDSWAASEASE